MTVTESINPARWLFNFSNNYLVGDYHDNFITRLSLLIDEKNNADESADGFRSGYRAIISIRAAVNKTKAIISDSSLPAGLIAHHLSWVPTFETLFKNAFAGHSYPSCIAPVRHGKTLGVLEGTAVLIDHMFESNAETTDMLTLLQKARDELPQSLTIIQRDILESAIDGFEIAIRDFSKFGEFGLTEAFTTALVAFIGSIHKFGEGDKDAQGAAAKVGKLFLYIIENLSAGAIKETGSLLTKAVTALGLF